MKKTNYILYIDMDGVLVDYNSGWLDLTKRMGIKPIENNYNEADLNRAFDSTSNSEFWSNLRWERGGKELWNIATTLFDHIFLLSSAAADTAERYDAVREGKLNWVRKNIPEMDLANVIIVAKSEQKQLYSNKISILIDDKTSTVDAWTQRGGYGILHDASKYRRTIEKLENIPSPLSLSEIAKHVIVRRQLWSST